MNMFGKHAPKMLDLGYSPVPLKTDRNPLLKGWQHLRDKPLSLTDVRELSGKHPWLGIGVAGGFNGLVPIDFDTDDPEIMAAVAKVLPRPNVAKRGSKGFTAFYRATDPIKGCKFMPPPPNVKPIIEVLTTGNCAIPPTMHPKIKQPYRWLSEKTLFNTPVDQLVTITPDHIERLRGVMQPWCPKRECVIAPTIDRSLVNDRRMRHFAEARIRNEAQRLARIQSGRNHALFRAAAALGKFVHNGIVSEIEVRSTLMQASRINAYVMADGEHQAQSTITSGLAISRNDRLPDLDAMSAGCPSRLRHLSSRESIQT